MDTSRATRPCEEVLECLVKWVVGRDPEMAEIAIEHLARIGQPGIEAMLAAAATPKTNIMHQFRWLSVVLWIGGERGPTENRYLRSLRRHWCLAIRQKAEAAFASLRTRRRSRKAGIGTSV